jgi:hypothetical protein
MPITLDRYSIWWGSRDQRRWYVECWYSGGWRQCVSGLGRRVVVHEVYKIPVFNVSMLEFSSLKTNGQIKSSPDCLVLLNTSQAKYQESDVPYSSRRVKRRTKGTRHHAVEHPHFHHCGSDWSSCCPTQVPGLWQPNSWHQEFYYESDYCPLQHHSNAAEEQHHDHPIRSI